MYTNLYLQDKCIPCVIARHGHALIQGGPSVGGGPYGQCTELRGFTVVAFRATLAGGGVVVSYGCDQHPPYLDPTQVLHP